MPKVVATKEDWIKLGYELFSDSGEDGLNVDKMSRALKCNKSSFYWHFKTKPEFLDRIIEFWIATDTSKIIEEVNLQTTAKNKILKLIELAFKKDSNLDFIFFLKKYSQRKKVLKTTIDKIDFERINFVSTLLEEFGYDKKNASTKSAIFYKYLIGYHEMIRYKKQTKDYMQDVLTDLNHLIKLNIGNE